MEHVELEESVEEMDKLMFDTLRLIHSNEYVEELRQRCSNLEEGKGDADTKQDVYFCRNTYDAAVLSSYAVIQGINTILKEGSNLNRGFCIVRPPGHHAQCGHAEGFCFFNNVGIAAKHARAKFGVKKICIFDWDIHHGDGTQS
jgi:histone deacetylase 6